MYMYRFSKELVICTCIGLGGKGSLYVVIYS